MTSDLPGESPGPGHYTSMKEIRLQQRHYGSQFTKAERKTYFDVIGHTQGQRPGPADYGKKRMFDNKQAIDYSKRLSALKGDSEGYGFSNEATHLSSIEEPKGDIEALEKEMD